MAEIVGLAASVAGLVELTATVFALGCRYISGVKGAEKDMEKLKQELIALASVLKTLGDQATGSGRFDDLKVPILTCTNEMMKLEAQLQPKMGIRRIIRRLKWPLNESQTSEVLASIERSKSLFTLALNAEQFHLSLAIEVYTKNADRKLGEVEKLLATELDILKQQRAKEELSSRSGNASTHRFIKFSLTCASKMSLVRERETILGWLYEGSLYQKHAEISGRRQKGTGQWIFEEPEFCKWIEGNTDAKLLWGYGIPGAGKTFISSLVIDHLESRCSSAEFAVAYTYFSYNEKEQQKTHKVMGSLIQQLAAKAQHLPPQVQGLYNRFVSRDKTEKPCVADLRPVLAAVMATFQRVFFVFDALDEYDEQDRHNELLPMLHFLRSQGASVFLTGRPYSLDIQESLNIENLAQIHIEAHEEDLRIYINQKIDDSAHSRSLIAQDLRNEIVHRLVECCNGMFLLVHFHIEELCGHTTPKQIRQALESLDMSLRQEDALNSIYKRALEDIQRQKTDRGILALRVLAWLFRAPVLFAVNTLALAVSIEDGMTDIRDIGEDSLPTAALILEVCRGLVIMDDTSTRVMFAHYSVKEYLVGNTEFMSRTSLEMANTSLTILGLRTLRYTNNIWNTYGSVIWDLAVDCLHEDIEACDHSQTHGRYIQFLESPAFNIYCKDRRGRAAHSLGGLDKERMRDLISSGLTDASSVGHLSAVEHFIHLGIDVATPTSTGNMALFIAVCGGYKDIAKLLLGGGASAHAEDYSGCSAIHMAAKHGHAELLRILVDHGACINARAKDSGETALFEAARHGNLECVKLLLARPAKDAADPTIQDHKGNTPMHVAAIHNRLEALRFMLNKGGKLSQTNYEGCTPFEMAARWGHLDVVRFIHNRCGLPTKSGYSGSLTLFDSAQKGHLECLNFILLNIIEASAQYWPGRAPISYAIEHNFIDAVVRLIERGAEVDTALKYAELNPAIAPLLIDKGADLAVATSHVPAILQNAVARSCLKALDCLSQHRVDISMHLDDDRITALHVAADLGLPEVVSHLLRLGANPSAENISGQTPLLYCLAKQRHRGNSDSAHSNLSKTAQELLPHCRNLQMQDTKGRTALHLAARSGLEELTLALIAKGSEVSLRDARGDTALHMAIRDDHNGVASVLLQNGADVSVANLEGTTPLMLAAARGCLSLTHRLLELGTRISAQDHLNRTVLHIAAESGHLHVVQALLGRGADLSTRDRSDKIALHYAIKAAHIDVVHELLQKGPQPSQTHPDLAAGLHLAAKNRKARRPDLISQ